MSAASLVDELAPLGAVALVRDYAAGAVAGARPYALVWAPVR